jgi:glycosyltransferase involved in cell wall biosynthesis
MTSELTNVATRPHVSIGIFAWNEERAIARCLTSLFEQSLFSELERRDLSAEILCVLNGCTDGTARIARDIFSREGSRHPHPNTPCSVVEIAERGKLNAWNRYVHELSAKEAEFLLLLDADILIHRKETLWKLVSTLQTDAEANVAVDVPRKNLSFKRRLALSERLSLQAAENTRCAEAQLCAQLYCIRSAIARSIYLPKDLFACEDGFIKALVCTDFLEHPVWPRRIRLAEGAEHTFEAYTSLAAVLRNQKRQIIGQTLVHILIDHDLKTLSPAARLRLMDTLRARDAADPSWLTRLVREHLGRVRYFWRLYPGVIGLRLSRWRKLRGRQRVAGLPAAALGVCLALFSAAMAHLALRRGCTQYWPRAERALEGPDASPAPTLPANPSATVTP